MHGSKRSSSGPGSCGGRGLMRFLSILRGPSIHLLSKPFKKTRKPRKCGNYFCFVRHLQRSPTVICFTWWGKGGKHHSSFLEYLMALKCLVLSDQKSETSTKFKKMVWGQILILTSWSLQMFFSILSLLNDLNYSLDVTAISLSDWAEIGTPPLILFMFILNLFYSIPPPK